MPAASLSNLQRAFRDSITAQQFASLGEGKWWALLTGATDCEGNRLDTPDVKDEFEMQRVLTRRKEFADSLRGLRIGFHGKGNARNGFRIGEQDEFAVNAATYDFTKKSYRVVIEAKADGKWPVGEERPRVKSVPFDNDVVYDNGSLISFDLRMSPDEAEEFKENMPLEVFLLLEFTGLYQHKICRRACDRILGVVVCGWDDNRSLGTLRKAKTIGYEVLLDGRRVAEKQPK